jgi:hypothetical protein
MIFVNRTSYIVPNGRMWKDTVVDYLEAYLEDLLEGTEENGVELEAR